jgi:uncharacterized protein
MRNKTSPPSIEAGLKRPPLIASPWHTAIVVGIAALNAYRGAIYAAQSRAGLGPSRSYMYLRTMVFECLFLAIVALGVRLRGKSLQTIFGQHWPSVKQMLRDAGIGLGLLFVSLLVGSLPGGQSAPPDRSIAFLLPQSSREMFLWIALSMVAGICEEAIYRGYLQRQLVALTHNVAAGIVIAGAAFGAVHAYQGWSRALVIGVSAILFGVLAEWRGTVRPGMFAHSLQDGIAPLLIKLLRQ